MIALRCILVSIAFAECATGFQNLIPNFQGFGLSKQLVPKTFGDTDLENQLLDAISQTERLSTSEEIDSIIAQLERSDKTLPRPSIAPQIYGRWRLLHTSNAATASPIQRKAVDASKFAIYQDISLRNENTSDEVLIVSQVVKFSDTAELRVDALASTPAYPLAELTDRKSTGKVLGLNILGVSLVGDEAAPDRIDLIRGLTLFLMRAIFSLET
ncbi:PAP fibrillin [Fragilaria crotonensis]|nr:PAP fibrillin [Fragilaria crotonensis]